MGGAPSRPEGAPELGRLRIRVPRVYMHLGQVERVSATWGDEAGRAHLGTEIRRPER